ncbi:hypothetical protein [Flexithrix dorotheae]|uniref:hypothetical protein n=1 Tax=Flexithrix dorotheae TaxID=70993 RepID=UPI0003610989|nr:hypothetical protein [Flexithrix dorotheae]
MVEVFITNIKLENQAIAVLESLESDFPDLLINFDLEDFQAPYPCGHSILRVEGKSINPQSIINCLRLKGFECEVLVDKICH